MIFTDSEHYPNSGEQREFSIKGLNLGSVGISKVTASGEVYGLHNISDFSGKYAGVEAGLTVAAGDDRIAVKNSKGVILVVDSVEQGVKLAIAAEGLIVQLK